MKCKIIFLLVIFIFVFMNNLFPQKITTQGRLTNSVYSFEDTSLHTRLYQTILMNAKYKSPYNLKLNLAARALTDINQTIDSERRFNAYRFSFSGEGLVNGLIDFELGRQVIHPGLPVGSMDGIDLNTHINENLQWQIYGGVETNFLRNLEINSDNNKIYGTAVSYRMKKRTIKILYLNKLNDSKNQWQITGLNYSCNDIDNLRLQLQSHYDLINDRMHRIYFSGYYSGLEKIKFNLFFKQQYPQIYQGSFFKTFKSNKYRQIGFGSHYLLSSKYYLTADYRYLEITDGKGHIFDLMLGNSNGTVGVIYETGDLGDQTSFFLDYSYEIIQNLSALLAIDYTRYRFEEIYDYEKQLSNTIRVSYKMKKHWMVDLEYQWLNNRYMAYDHRILNHIHYIW